MKSQENQNHFGKKQNQQDSSILFLLINYNNKKEILKFIDQFEEVSKCVSFLILNNGGNVKEWIEPNLFDNAFIYNSEENLGYIGGAKFLFKKNEFDFRYMILCNSDIYLDAKSFVKTILNKNYDKNISIVGPNIGSPHKKNQNPFLSNPPSKEVFKKWKTIYKSELLFTCYYFLSKYKSKLLRKEVIDKNPFALHGAFLIFINNPELTVDYFDSEIFLFGEEIHIGFIAQKKQQLLFLDSNLSVFHDEHSSTGRLSMSFRRKELLKSIKVLEKEIYGNDE
ncbi:hypothetical protein NSA39_04775 [Enterococcus gallinarum]|uniref:hypothetical protein n=1 Tax=Enterococcus gallinarum TaxID=1353 RepID=UPI00214C31A9|nr:hypothetical protein [Enterococcus gallinarum]MCR1927176.1 hypothetical protein [Enterococcus gallinarum]